MTATPLAIARVELLRAARDRTYLFFTLLLPFLVILLVGVTFYRDDSRLPVAVAWPAGDDLAAQLVEDLEAEDGLEVQSAPDADSARAALRRDEVAAAVVVPDDYGRALASGATVEVAVLAPPGSGRVGALRASIEGAAADQSAEVVAARAVSSVSGRSFDEALQRAREVGRGARVGVTEELVAGSGDAHPDDLDQAGTFGFAAPQNLVLFAFVNSLAGAVGLVETRRLGIWRRLVASPNRLATVLAGLLAARLVIALVQSAVIVLAGAAVFGVSWGNPLAAAALVLSFAVVSAGAGLLVGALARTPEQATSVSPPIGIALGMLGGCMWPLEIVPPVMRTVGHLGPHAWAIDGWTDVAVRGEGLASIATELAILAGFAAVLVTTGWVVLRHRLASATA